MKIGLVCPYDITKGGGVQEIVKALQAGLLKRGHNVYIITPRPQNHFDDPVDRTIFIGASTDFRAPTRTTIQVSASVADSIDEMLEKEKFDVIHFHEPWIPMISSQILARSEAANVATFHAKLPETAMVRTAAKMLTPYSKSILKYIDFLTAPSDAAAEYVCSLTDDPVAIIPNGIDLKNYKPPKKFNDKRKNKTIFYVGRLEGRKGVKYLLGAFKMLSEVHPDVSLVIGGDGPQRNMLELLADDLKLKNVSFLGYISHEEKIKYLQNSDLFCAPALFGESFGVVLLEAMASGLVTVAGDNPGYSAVMNGLGALSLVNPKDSVDFARRLELLLYNNDLRKLWRKWALGEVKQYRWERIVAQFEQAYKEALAAKKKRHE
jgi:phosphatidylinositol alpha-mannosyltransferase